jgi:hypothetical protein
MDDKRVAERARRRRLLREEARLRQDGRERPVRGAGVLAGLVSTNRHPYLRMASSSLTHRSSTFAGDSIAERNGGSGM